MTGVAHNQSTRDKLARRHGIGIDIDISWIRTSIDGKYELKSKNFVDIKDGINGVQRFNLGGKGLLRSVPVAEA
jgi:hypothetical protein